MLLGFYPCATAGESAMFTGNLPLQCQGKGCIELYSVPSSCHANHMISGGLKSHKKHTVALYLFKYHVMKIQYMVNGAVAPYILNLSTRGERFAAAMDALSLGKSPSTHWMTSLFGPRASMVVVAQG